MTPLTALYEPDHSPQTSTRHHERDGKRKRHNYDATGHAIHLQSPLN